MKHLFSLEVFIKKVYFRSDVVCNLPSISFRLLKYPIQHVYITDELQLSSLQAKIQKNPKEIECLTKLADDKGNIGFYRGKSCLFSAHPNVLLDQLQDVPLYIAVADVLQKKPKFIGSTGISLQSALTSIMQDNENTLGKKANVKGYFYLKNLMGKRVGKISTVVNLFHYGPQEQTDNRRPNKNSTSNESDISLIQSETNQSCESDNSCEKSVSDFIAPLKNTPYPPPLLYFSPGKPETKPQVKTPNPKSETNVGMQEKIPTVAKAPFTDNFLSESANDTSIFEGGYDPKKFDLIRAVLMELTYLTDFLDSPRNDPVANSSQETSDDVELSPPKLLTPKAQPDHNRRLDSPKKLSPHKSVTSNKPHTYYRRKLPFGLTNSYVLRLSKLGPEKMQQTLSKFLGQDGANSLVKRYFQVTKDRSKELLTHKIVDENAEVKRRPEITSTECQTDPLIVPTIAWQPVYNTQTPYVTGTVPFGLCPGYDTPKINTNQSTGSLTMAEVIQAIQALTQTTQFRPSSPIKSQSPEQHQQPPTRGSRASILRTSSKLSNVDYNYSDNFEEPSSVDVKSRRSSLSRAATSRVSIKSPCTPIPYEAYGDRNSESSIRKPTKNTRYQKGSVPSTTHESTSPTTSTNSTVQYESVFRRKSSKSQESQTSLSSENVNKLPDYRTRTSSDTHSDYRPKTPSDPHSPSNRRASPIVKETMSVSPSTSVDTVIRTPSRPQSRARQYSATPSDGLTREISEHLDVVSDHSSLRSSSIHIGGSDSDSITEVEEEDPLKLSYLLSTESVQFSDDDQPTSLLKLCSTDEARAANQFMYTY